jgi:hypothetical protein
MLSALRNLRPPPPPQLLAIARRAASTFGLTEVHQSIQATAAAFANSELVPKAAATDRNHAFPKEAVQRMGEMGFMGIAVPEQCVCPFSAPPPSPPPAFPHQQPHSRDAPPPPHRYGGAGLDNVSCVLCALFTAFL